jgi:hypothetical protein
MSQHSASNPSGATAAGASGESGTSGTSSGSAKRTAGIFDIRVIIGALLGLFGLILVLTSLLSDPQAQVAKANDVDLNLWTGLSLLAAAAMFIAWAYLRPIVVDESAASSDDRPPGH